MTRRMLLALAAAGSFALAGGLARAAEENRLTAREEAEGWKLLFDGRTLQGWEATGKKESWAVEDGAIACLARGGGYLYTPEQFGDFVLALDFKYEKRANSGIFLRWSDLRDPVNTGIEVQVYDSHGKPNAGRHDCGALYDLVAPTKNTAKPAGEWNRAVITCRGPEIVVELNGEKVTRIDLDQYTTARQNPDGTRNKFRYALKDFARRGHVGLQDHGGRVWFRNVKLKPLASGG